MLCNLSSDWPLCPLAAQIRTDPATYWSLLTNLAVDDPGLVMSSTGATEMSRLVENILSCGKTHPGPAPADVLKKMISHVRDNIHLEIASGYNTTEININIFRVLAAAIAFDRAQSQEEEAEAKKKRRIAMGEEEREDIAGGFLNALSDALNTHTELVQAVITISNEDRPGSQVDAISKPPSKPTMAEMMSTFGVIELIVDVISSSGGAAANDLLVGAALQTGIELLGGSVESVRYVQSTFLSYFLTGPPAVTEGFYTSLGAIVCDSTAAMQEGRPLRSVLLNIGADEIYVIRLAVQLLQLLCEGHYLPMQNLMSSQPRHKKTIDLVDAVVGFTVAIAPDNQALRSMGIEELQLVEFGILFMVRNSRARSDLALDH